MNINLNNFLYRGQDIHNRKWVYGFLVIQEEQAFIVEYSNWIDEDYSEMVAKEVDIETVGQCTGYLDTKDNRIFKGDIIYMPSWKSEYMQVCYAQAAFYLAGIESPNNYLGDIYYVMHGGLPQATVVTNVYGKDIKTIKRELKEHKKGIGKNENN